MGTIKQFRVDQLDMDAIASQGTNGQKIAELERQIHGLQYKLSDKVKEAIKNQGIRVTDLSMDIGLSYSGLSQLLRHAFNMSIETMGSFMKELFPGTTVDEVTFGYSRETRIPVIPNLFINIYKDMSDHDKQEICQKLPTKENPEAFDREERVKEIYDSNGSNRAYDEFFSACTTVKTNAASSLFWRATNEDLLSFRTRTYMRFAVISNYAMDYFCNSDYTNCNLTMLSKNLDRVVVPESSKTLLRGFNWMPSKQDRLDLVADMLATVALSRKPTEGELP